MSGPLRHLKLLWLFVRVSIQDDAAYRVDFLTNVVLAALQLVGELAVLWTVFANTHSLAGWGPYELLALLGVFRIMSGVITLVIAPNMRLIMEEIRDGKLDYAVIKPIDSQFYVSCRKIVVWELSDVVLGMLLILVSLHQLRTAISVGSIATFLVMLSAGAIIIYSFWLVLATLAFWLTRVSNMEMVFWNVFEAGRYPVDIYRPWLRMGLTFVIPLAFLTTLPAGSLVGRTPLWLVIVAMTAACVSLAGASAFWRFGLRRYSGASA